MVTSAPTSLSRTAPQHLSRSRVYRDDAGRERSEAFYDSGQLMTVVLRSPGETSVVMLNLVSKTAHVLFEPPPALPQPGKIWAVEELAAKTIAGVRARGERFTRTISAMSTGTSVPITVVEDLWFSDELGIVLELIFQDPRSGTTTKTVTGFERVEPDPTLFKIPDGYAVQQSGPGSE